MTTTKSKSYCNEGDRERKMLEEESFEPIETFSPRMIWHRNQKFTSGLFLELESYKKNMLLQMLHCASFFRDAGGKDQGKKKKEKKSQVKYL